MGSRISAGSWVLPVLFAWEAAAASWQTATASIAPYESVRGTYDAARQEVVVIGGGEGKCSPYCPTTWGLDASGFRLGPAAPAGLVPGPMAYDAARGRTVLFSEGTTAATWEYDGATWRAGAPPGLGLTARDDAALAYDAGRQRVVLYGGKVGSLAANETWEYDGIAWSPGPPGGMAGRYGHAMAYDAARGRVVLHGGHDGRGVRLDTWLYDGTTWIEVAAGIGGPPPRQSHAMAFDSARARVILFGGYGRTGIYLKDTWYFDGAAWTKGAPPPAGMPGLARGFLAYDAARDRTVLAAYPSNDVWEHDGTTWSLASGPPPGLKGRQWHGMAYDAGRGRAVLFGGWNGGLLDDTWELAAGSTWTRGPAAAPGLTPRYGHGMVYDARLGRTLLVGGWDGAARSDVWTFDGASWQPDPAAPLAPRQLMAIAHDPWRGRTVLQGGSDGTLLHADTWTLDAGGWSSGPAGPGPLASHAMAFDAARGVCVLFGGWNGTDLSAETWELSASTWQRSPLQGPQARGEHAMAFDPVSGTVVLQGGHFGGGYFGGDSWRYDAFGWAEASRSSYALPYPRARHAMVHDAARGALLLLGGDGGPYSGTELLNDAWELRARGGLVAGPGPDPVNGNRVTVVSSEARTTTIDFFAYAAGGYGTRVGAGDIEATALDEILTGPGPAPSLGPQLRAFRPQGGGPPIAKVNFYAYGTLKWGVNPASAQLDADPPDEILAAPGPGDVFGPHVRGFDYDGVAVTPIPGVSFFAYATLKLGAEVAGGDVDTDGFGEIVTAPGPGATFGAQIRGFDVDGAAARPIPGLDFLAFGTTYGATVAAGDADGDPRDEIVAGAGPGPTAAGTARGFELQAGAVRQLPAYDVPPRWLNYGARVTLSDLDRDAAGELALAVGPDPSWGACYSVYAYQERKLVLLDSPICIFHGAAYGATIAGGRFGR